MAVDWAGAGAVDMSETKDDVEFCEDCEEEFAPELCQGCHTALCTACFTVGGALCGGCGDLTD